MPQFQVQFDGIGFTPKKSLIELQMSDTQAGHLSKKWTRENKMPRGVLGICAANASPDGGKEDGMWKVFVGITLLVEAAGQKEAENMAPPEDFLLEVANRLVRGDAEAEYGLSGSFEVLQAEEVQAAVPDKPTSGTAGKKARP
jgi:hypothetical protein